MAASVRVTGGEHAQREAFRERVRWLLVRDPDAPAYEDGHDGDAVTYAFDAGGIPFPAFVDASRAFGALRIEAAYPASGQSPAGRVVFQGGMVVEKVDL